MAKKKQETVGDPRIEFVALDEIPKWPRNPRTHDDAAIERSIRKYGFVNPVIIDEKSGKLVAGHGRLAALEALQAAGEPPPARVQVGAGGRWRVPVLRGIAFNNAAEAEAYLVADNRISELGGWDMESLREIVSDLSNDGLELDALGWSAAALDKLLADEPEKKSRVKAAGSGGGDTELTGLASARMLPIYLSADTYQPTVDRMRAIMDAYRLTDYTALLLFLLDQHTAVSAATSVKASTGSDPFSAPE